MFENIRNSLDDLLSRTMPPEERREAVSRMRDTLIQAKMGLQDLRDAVEKSRQRLTVERRELETVERRRRLAAEIGDAETVRVAEHYAAVHAERVAVVERKVAAQESELALAEREVAEMSSELRAAALGTGPRPSDAGAERVAGAGASGVGDEGDGGTPLREAMDGLARARARAEREANAERLLAELKRRMGK